MSSGGVGEVAVDSLMSLSQAAVGCDFRIRVVAGPQCERLRELGFCESMRVRKLVHGHNLVCTVCGTRMGLSPQLADQVLVGPEEG